jgi:hypothetical protein
MAQVRDGSDIRIEFMRARPDFVQSVWGRFGRDKKLTCTHGGHTPKAESCRKVRQGCAGDRGVAVGSGTREQSSGYVLFDKSFLASSQVSRRWERRDSQPHSDLPAQSSRPMLRGS